LGTRREPRFDANPTFAPQLEAKAEALRVWPVTFTENLSPTEPAIASSHDNLGILSEEIPITMGAVKAKFPGDPRISEQKQWDYQKADDEQVQCRLQSELLRAPEWSRGHHPRGEQQAPE
jgi:hypothetical protein